VSDESRDTPEQEERAQTEVSPENVRAVRLGHGANCSSVGSVIDTLFLASAMGGAIFAAICAAMKEEPVRVVGEADAKRVAGEETDTKEGDMS